MTDDRPPPESEAQTTDSGGRLWEEYRLIQAKIDKIGEHQFKVKSWSVTLIGALLIISGTERLLVAIPCGFAVAFVFHLSEHRQRLLSRRLGARAADIERTFIEFPPIADRRLWSRIKRRIPAMRSVPGIADALATDRDHQKKTWSRAKLRWLTEESDNVFYWVQYGLLTLVFVGLLFHYWNGDTKKEEKYEILMRESGIKVFESKK